jgi:dephospho-CoA kinase
VRTIGLTGGLCTGKSTVAAFLAELGAVILNADEIGHEALQPECEVNVRIAEMFGREVLGPSGEIDRRLLGEIVFNSPECLLQLNRTIHPWIREAIEARLDNYRRKGVKVVVLEAALLIEADWLSLIDEVWVTMAPKEIVLKRFMERTDLSADECEARTSCQLPAEERLKYADVVIDTDTSRNELKKKVEKLWQEFIDRERINS